MVAQILQEDMDLLMSRAIEIKKRQEVKAKCTLIIKN